MAAEEDFEGVFDASILKSLEGALNDISLQMQPSSLTEGDALSSDSDYSSSHDDDAYTNDTYGNGFSSAEEEDPETGEREFFTMMDDLVAELETEMEFFTDKNENREEPTLPMEEGKVKGIERSKSDPNLGSPSRTPTDEKAGMNCTTEIVSQNRCSNSNKQRAKSLLKVLSGLAQPEDLKNMEKSPLNSLLPKNSVPKTVEEERERDAVVNGTEIDKQTTGRYTQPLSDSLSSAEAATDDGTKSERQESPRAPYVPTQEDFQEFVGVLAEYSKRTRSTRIPQDSTHSTELFGSGSSNTAKVEENSKDQSEPAEAVEESGLHVCELSDPDEEETIGTQGQREKTSRAMASFTLKKRREYMKRKSQQSRKNTVVVTKESRTDTAARDTLEHLPDEKKQRQSMNSEPVQLKSSRKKKRRQRTKKHRKGRPKKSRDVYQYVRTYPVELSQAASQNQLLKNENDKLAREAAVRALAKTEIWQWLVIQAREGPSSEV